MVVDAVKFHHTLLSEAGGATTWSAALVVREGQEMRRMEAEGTVSSRQACSLFREDGDGGGGACACACASRRSKRDRR